jgi:hypothetical protein
MASTPLAIRTLFADLLQRTLDAEFDDEFSPAGDFQKRKWGNRYYWYYREGGREGQKTTPRYVGPVTDASVTDRIVRFSTLKSDFRERQSTVRALVAAGLPSPDPLTGAIVEAMHRAGFFRLRGFSPERLRFRPMPDFSASIWPAARSKRRIRILRNFGVSPKTSTTE